jgi:hypothetical protein
MYQGHWQSKLVHFFNLGSHVRILANETRGRITTIDSIHHSRSLTVSLDHLPHGTTRIPSQLPKVNGTGIARTAKCSNLH